MKIIAHQGEDYLATVTQDEIALLLGFHSKYDDAFKAWLRKKTNHQGNLAVGTDVQVLKIGEFWNSVLHKEAEIGNAAKTMRALADLMTTSLPSGIVPPAPPKEPAS
jgi:hypothetical protein